MESLEPGLASLGCRGSKGRADEGVRGAKVVQTGRPPSSGAAPSGGCGSALRVASPALVRTPLAAARKTVWATGPAEIRAAAPAGVLECPCGPSRAAGSTGPRFVPRCPGRGLSKPSAAQRPQRSRRPGARPPRQLSGRWKTPRFLTSSPFFLPPKLPLLWLPVGWGRVFLPSLGPSGRVRDRREVEAPFPAPVAAEREPTAPPAGHERKCAAPPTPSHPRPRKGKRTKTAPRSPPRVGMSVGYLFTHPSLSRAPRPHLWSCGGRPWRGPGNPVALWMAEDEIRKRFKEKLIVSIPRVTWIAAIPEKS